MSFDFKLSLMPLPDLVLQQTFVYLHESNRASVLRVCRRWRDNSFFVGPLQSLYHLVNLGRESTANILLDTAREYMPVATIPHDLVFTIVLKCMHTTAKRLSEKDLSLNPNLQVTLFNSLFCKRYPSHITESARRATFDVLFAHSIHTDTWSHILRSAVENNRHYETRRILHDQSRSPISKKSTWFHTLFVDYAIRRGNVKLSQLYINDWRFDTKCTQHQFRNVCKAGYSAIVRMFLRQRPELDLNDGGTNEPLRLAIRYGHRKTVELLLADPRCVVAADRVSTLLSEAFGSFPRISLLLHQFLSQQGIVNLENESLISSIINVENAPSISS